MFGGKNPSAFSQVILVSLTCFTCPGLFNALNQIAGGVKDETVSFNTTALLYACFAVSGLFSGGIVNVIGPKFTLFIGTWGYVLYIASLLVVSLSYDEAKEVYTNGAIAFYYASNAILGVCAGLLWTAQGQICMAYPTSETKGTYFAYFWVIFNLGGVLGGFLIFGTNYDLKTGSPASTTTYVVFLILMSLGAFISLVLSKPENVVRNDGSAVVVERLPSPSQEIVETFKLFLDPKMVLLFPLFAYSNWFYGYDGFYNGANFNKRTSGLSASFFWGSQMIGAYFIGKYLDRATSTSRKTKAIRSIYVLVILIFSMWALGLYAQISLDLGLKEKKRNVDFQEGRWWPVLLLYTYYGFNDSIVQVWSYWLMGQFSDDLATLGRYAGYYKAVQSGMAAVGWRLEGIPISSVASLLINWSLAAVGLVGAYISVRTYMPEESEGEYKGIETPGEHKSVMVAH